MLAPKLKADLEKNFQINILSTLYQDLLGNN